MDTLWGTPPDRPLCGDGLSVRQLLSVKGQRQNKLATHTRQLRTRPSSPGPATWAFAHADSSAGSPAAVNLFAWLGGLASSAPTTCPAVSGDRFQTLHLRCPLHCTVHSTRAQAASLLPHCMCSARYRTDRAMHPRQTDTGEAPTLEQMIHDPKPLCSEGLCLEEAASPRAQSTDLRANTKESSRWRYLSGLT